MTRTRTMAAAVVMLAAVGGWTSAVASTKRDQTRRGAPGAWAARASVRWERSWASMSCASPARVRRVLASGATSGRAYRFEVRDGDDSWGERCELGQGNPTRAGFPLFHSGQERWISFQVYLPRDYPIATPRWNVINQLKQLGGLGTPALAMQVTKRRFRLLSSSSPGDSCCTIERWSGPARRRRWVRFTLRVRFSPSSAAGRVALYGDLGGRRMRPLLRPTHTYTMKRDAEGRAVDSHVRIGLYRDPRIEGTAHLLYGGFAVAPTRARAERAAFGPRR